MPFFFLIFSALAQATCLDASVVKEIRQEISLPILKIDPCDESRDSYKLLTALSFLKTNRLPEAENPLNKNIVSADGWNFLRSRVTAFVNEPTCALGQMAFVRAHMPGVVHLCPSFYDPSFTVVERLPTLLHEAHHFDGDNFSHVNCQQGRLKGMRNACDPGLEYGGGYAVETEVLVKLARLSDQALAPELKARARNMALLRAAENFNAPVVPYRLETIYLWGADGRGYLLHPESMLAIEAPSLDPRSVSIVSRGSSLNIFPRDGSDAYAVDVLSGFEHLPVQGEVSLGFNRRLRNERPEMVAILNEANFSGFITSRRFSVALGDNPYETEVDLPFRATAVFTGAELGWNEPDTLYLKEESGRLVPIKLLSGRRHEILAPVGFPAGFSAFTIFQDKRLGLREDGVLVRLEGNEWREIDALKGKRFSFLSRPFYWAPFLRE
jgi:hypothetical protein